MGSNKTFLSKKVTGAGYWRVRRVPQAAPRHRKGARRSRPSYPQRLPPLRREGLNWNFIQQFDSNTGRFTTASDALSARLVDGRDADLVTLGKIAAAMIPAIRKLAQTNAGLFLLKPRGDA